MNSGDVEGNVPVDVAKVIALLSDAGPLGIQGLYHSTSVEAHLYAMFGWHDLFDYLLVRSEVNVEVQRALKEGIVNPLRTTHFVGARKVLALLLALMKACSLPPRIIVEEDGIFITTLPFLTFPCSFSISFVPSRAVNPHANRGLLP